MIYLELVRRTRNSSSQIPHTVLRSTHTLRYATVRST
jgi:hypothetical protein